MQGRAVHLDWETRSTVDLRKAGAYRYAEHPDTGIWLARYKFTDEEIIRSWERGQPFPSDLEQHVASGGIVKAHNAAFERIIWNYVARRDHGVQAVMTPEQCDCTMARAFNVSLPGALEAACKVLNLPQQKDMAGKENMMRMAKPRRVEPDGTIVWWDEPERIERLGSYCDDDILAEEGLDHVLPPLTERERYIYVMDQHMNDYGVMLDMPVVYRAQELVVEARKRLTADIIHLTQGDVTSYTQNASIVKWLNKVGVECASFGKEMVDGIRAECKRQGNLAALAVVDKAKEAGKTSVNKLAAMIRSVCHDGRARGTIQYYGASGSGRWAGRLWQPHNLPRVDEETELPYVRRIIELLQSDKPIERVHDIVQVTIGQPIPWVSRCLRAMIVAATGKILVGADFSNIEGRVAAWLAGEQWKLDAFRSYDNKTGHDLYKLAYASSFGCKPEEVTKPQRQIGKVEELALGFQGGVGAFMSMADNYSMDISDIAHTVMQATSSVQFDAQLMEYKTATDKFSLPPNEWAALKIIVKGWRGAHPRITQAWWDLQDAAIEAVSNPGRMVTVLEGKVQYCFVDGFLWCYLPTGRTLAYFNARIVWQKRFGKNRRTVRCSGRDNKRGGAWSDNVQLYGGLQFENIVQACARDALADALMRIDYEPDMPVALHVHDEGVSEVSIASMNPEKFSGLMSVPCAAMPGLPISVGAWIDKRYVK